MCFPVVYVLCLVLLCYLFQYFWFGVEARQRQSKSETTSNATIKTCITQFVLRKPSERLCLSCELDSYTVDIKSNQAKRWSDRNRSVPSTCCCCRFEYFVYFSCVFCFSLVLSIPKVKICVCVLLAASVVYNQFL